MTVDVMQRPATSSGKTSCSGVLLRSKQKKKPSGFHHISTKAAVSPEHNGDDEVNPRDEKTLQKKGVERNQVVNSDAMFRKLELQVDKTTQLTNMLRSEEAKLSQELLIASEKGKKHAAYLLLHQGIDKERCKGMSGYSPLHYAATRGHLEVIQLLLDFGWNVDARNDSLETPLHLAAYNGHTAIAECLLDRGADVNAQNDDDETALFYAARKHHYRIVRLLIRRECNLSLKNRFGDIAEEEVSQEKTRLEFTVGNEDAHRLYALRSSGPGGMVQPQQTISQRSHGGGGGGGGEQSVTQQQREHVLSFLDLKSLCLASQIAYRWHRAADNPTLWRKLGVSRWELLLSATMGIGTVSPMSLATGGFHLDFPSAMGRTRPSSCDQSNSRFMAPSIKRKSVRQHGDEHRPQTARLCGGS